ncbi:ferric reductase NAD binding domain-containing protein [Kickxella alabastrina]|uniref:ferric reductase NAD binding domain-containing protein n=1 Tax=Kickxella alabastrina TaxID=61397 RepID=UPI0022208CA4|nr:ferric reductase NAD binding domain-containing protein [Kickxella alabastrina]KAI7825874.1 ferric reductase NAD binding domain-containing protein [Kickxella alabastrina]
MASRNYASHHMASKYASQLANSRAFEGQPIYTPETKSSSAWSLYLQRITPQRVVFVTFWLAVQVLIISIRTIKGKNAGDTLTGFNRGMMSVIMFNFSSIFLFKSPTLLTFLRKTFLARVFVFEKSAHAHKFAGYIMTAAIIVHVSIQYYKFHKIEVTSKGKTTFLMLSFHKKTGIIGHSMLFIITVMLASAIPPVRRKMFEVFYLLHHLYIVIIILLFQHIAVSTFKYYIAVPGSIYALDRLYRFLRSRTNHPEIISVIQHPSNVIELRFAKHGMKVKAGQFIYLNVPSLAWFQWHPFTLTSAPEEDQLSVHISVAGDWTRKLVKAFRERATRLPKRLEIIHHSVPIPARVHQNDAQDFDFQHSYSVPTTSKGSYHNRTQQHRSGFGQGLVQNGILQADMLPELDYYASASNSRNIDEVLNRNKMLPAAPSIFQGMPTIMVDGPYGAPTQHVFDYEYSVLIANGIGLTPMSSILRSLYYQLTSQLHQRKVKKMYFLWVCRDTRSLEWFRDLLAALDEEDIGDVLEIRTYLTGPLSLNHICNITLNQSSNGPDAITGLYRSPTYYGRPNFDKIFEEIGMRNPNTDIGLFVCGSKSLSSTVKDVTIRWNRELSHRSTRFVYHSETST